MKWLIWIWSFKLTANEFNDQQGDTIVSSKYKIGFITRLKMIKAVVKKKKKKKIPDVHKARL